MRFIRFVYDSEVETAFIMNVGSISTVHSKCCDWSLPGDGTWTLEVDSNDKEKRGRGIMFICRDRTCAEQLQQEIYTALYSGDPGVVDIHTDKYTVEPKKEDPDGTRV